ncbi:MAG: cytochrome b561 domain-containing protein [Spirochaetales bacterium]|nr:cytochrome b561 domain-containing protein [Spirochaetales bacterium]
MSYYTQIILHMTLMIVFFTSMSAGVYTAKFLKKKTSKWLKLHKIFMTTGLVSGLTGFGWIIYVVQSGLSPHFTVFHAILGLVTLSASLTAPLVGLKLMSKKTDKSKKPLLRKLHRTIGWTGILLVLISVVSGLSLFGIITVPFL